MKHKANLLKRTTEKSTEGRRGVETFTKIKDISIGDIMAKTNSNIERIYGKEISFSYLVFTYDDCSIDEIIEFNNKKYVVKQILSFPRINHLLLELI